MGPVVIAAIGTYLPVWGTDKVRVAGSDEDVVTMAVAAGLAALDGAPVDRVVLVSSDLPLLEGGNGAALLGGLGLPAVTEVREQLGGAPAVLAAVAEAGDQSVLVIGSDLRGAPGAAAVRCGAAGAELTVTGRVTRSMPLTTRDDSGHTTDYADPRLGRERGLLVSLAEAGVEGKVDAVAGIVGKDAVALCEGVPPVLPTRGASSAIFALAALAERRDGGRLLAVEQATVVAAVLSSGTVSVRRDEPTPRPVPATRTTPGSDIAISLAAYERAFDAKLRLDAAACTSCGTLSYPARYRCLECGSEEPTEISELPRDAVVYTAATIHVPVPGLATPYTVVLAELGGSGVRLLVRLTGAAPGSVAIGDTGTLVFRLVAMRSGVPDYGYAFRPSGSSEQTEVAA